MHQWRRQTVELFETTGGARQLDIVQTRNGEYEPEKRKIAPVDRMRVVVTLRNWDEYWHVTLALKT